MTIPLLVEVEALDKAVARKLDILNVFIRFEKELRDLAVINKELLGEETEIFSQDFLEKNAYLDENGYYRFNKYYEEEDLAGKLIHRQVAYEYIYLQDRAKYPLGFGSYEIHHKDSNKLNNHPDNLELFTKEEHKTMHRIK